MAIVRFNRNSFNQWIERSRNKIIFRSISKEFWNSFKKTKKKSGFIMLQSSLKISAVNITMKGKEELSQQIQALRNQGASWQEINKVTPVALTTIRRWNKTSMDSPSQLFRSVHNRRPTTLSQEEGNQLIDDSKIRRSQFKPVDTAWASTKIKEITNGRVGSASKSSISKFYKKHGWHSWKVQPRNSKELRLTLEEEIDGFRSDVYKYMDQHSIPKSRVWVMDETGLWNGSVLPRTYVDPQTRDASVESIGDHQRDTGVVALSWEGRVFPWFIRHVNQQTRKRNGQKVIIREGISGINLILMELWARDFQLHIGDGPAILLLDRLSSHVNHKIIEMLNGFGITVFLLPPQSGKSLSPCDNFFFASLKAAMRKHDCSTTSLKEIVFHQCCYGLSPETVVSCWVESGWVHPSEQNEGE
jgi:transposase